MEDINEKVGQKIQYFRKLRHMTVAQLADRLGKKPVTIYKYEAGDIALDLPMVQAVAKVLQINPLFLLEALDNWDATQETAEIQSFQMLYVYHYDGRFDQVMMSQIQTYSFGTEGRGTSMLYYNLAKPGNVQSAQYLYNGVCHNFDHITYFHFRNTQNRAEFMDLSCLNPWTAMTQGWGLFTGILDSAMVPATNKIRISTSPLPPEEVTREKLQFGKAELLRLKNTNFLTIQRVRN